MTPGPAWIYVIIEALMEALPLVVLGEASLDTLLLHEMVSPVAHSIGILAIALVSVVSVTVFIVRRREVHATHRPRHATLSLLLVLCVGLIYWNLSISPLYFFYVHSLLEPLTIAGLSLAQAMLVYVVARLLTGWARNSRFPFILGAIVPFLVTPFHPFLVIAWALGAISGWLGPSDESSPRVHPHPSLVFTVVIFGYALLINAVFGTFVIGAFRESAYEEAFTFDFAVAMLYAGSVKKITSRINERALQDSGGTLPNPSVASRSLDGRTRVSAPRRAQMIFYLVGIPVWYVVGLGSCLAMFAHEANLALSKIGSLSDRWEPFAAIMVAVSMAASYACYRVSTIDLGRARLMGRYMQDGFGALDLFEGMPTLYSALVSLVIGVAVTVYFGAHYIDPFLQGARLGSRILWGVMAGGVAGLLTGNFSIRLFLATIRR